MEVSLDILLLQGPISIFSIHHIWETIITGRLRFMVMGTSTVFLRIQSQVFSHASSYEGLVPKVKSETYRDGRGGQNKQQHQK